MIDSDAAGDANDAVMNEIMGDDDPRIAVATEGCGNHPEVRRAHSNRRRGVAQRQLAPPALLSPHYQKPSISGLTFLASDFKSRLFGRASASAGEEQRVNRRGETPMAAMG